VKAPGRILGIDFGTRRVGIAVSDPLNIIARPIAVLSNNHNIHKKIVDLAQEHQVGLIVVGMPYTLRGDRAEKGKEVEQFVLRLKERSGLEVVTIDERFTSVVAQQTMRMMGSKKRQREDKGKIDEMASALILQSYLDRRRW
jgi:putative Holliday junction resolvase